MTTDPTPIAADPHVSGGVEELLRCPFCGDAEPIEQPFIADGLNAMRPLGIRYIHCEACGADGPGHDDIADARRAWNIRLAVTLVPANAEGVREAAARAAYESWYKDAPYSWDNERGQKDLWYRIIDAVSPILTTRPTDTAAREAAVEAATVERCAKVADAVESQDEAAEPAYLDACQTISERIRALTPAHIADAGEGDTAAREAAVEAATVEQCAALPSHPRENVRPAFTDTMTDLLDAYEQRIWVWAQGCEVDDIRQRSVIGDSYNEGHRDDANKARIALIRQIDALTTEPAHIADAGEGDTAARDEGMVR